VIKKALYNVVGVLLCSSLFGCSLFNLPFDEPSAHEGELVSISKNIKNSSFQTGDFIVSFEGASPSAAVLKINHKSNPLKILWETTPGKSFIIAAKGHEVVEESKGSFSIEDETKLLCLNQSVTEINNTASGIELKGFLECDGTPKKSSYSMIFSAVSENRLGFEVKIDDPDLNRTYLTYKTEKEEHFFGFGEQFSNFDVKGKRLPIFVMEQGVGRGIEPLTFFADLTAGSGGKWHTSYAGVPQYITSQQRSFFLKNYEYSVFDLREDDEVQITLFSGNMKGEILNGNTPLELIQTYTEYSGRMRELPEWIHQGAILGIQGGTERTLKIYNEAINKGVPVAAVWLQDWVGQRTTSFGKQLWWNWELDTDHYPEWQKLTSALNKNGTQILTYINPFFADIKDKGNAKTNQFEELKKLGYLIKNKEGNPYLIENTSFSAGLIDLTNPKARLWIKALIKKELLTTGAAGWMADFGEALPYDAVLFEGSPEQYHNRYPEEWAKLNREAIQEAGLDNKIVFFSRSGYTTSPGKSTLFWLGDQVVTWDEHDGIKTAVTGLLSSGISGYSLNHSDIGGYTTISSPIKDYHRSKELLLRWIELNAFTTVFRSHEGNRPGDNHQFYSDDETFNHFARFAKIYKAWGFYRKELVKQASQTGIPVVRHLYLHYPEDPNVLSINHEEFLVGSEILVVPVLDEGTTQVEAYLPAGGWVHLWSGKTYSSEDGVTVNINAPIGEPAVFYKQGSAVGEKFRAALDQQKLLNEVIPIPIIN
jgi:alpha-glucosidase